MSRMTDEVEAGPWGDFICHDSGERLERRGDRLQAGEGGRTYEVRDGVPILLFGDPMPEDDREALRKLNEDADREGWRAAVERHFGDDVQSIRYVTDESRLKLIDLLDVGPDDVVLDFGASLGTFTVELARRARLVHAIDIVPGQVAFAARRCRQEGRENVVAACGGDRCRLPYRDAMFDAVFFNLVFEWCAWRDGGDFLAGQRQVLAEIHRVLKPGGRLLLSTKNRYALTYLTGRPDEHAQGLRFGNALPRWLMHALYRRKSGGSKVLNGLLHSHDALSRLIEGAGFERPRSFWAAPEMRYPKDYVPTDAASIREARRRPDFVQGDSRSTRALMSLVPAPLVKHFTKGLTFVASKPS